MFRSVSISSEETSSFINFLELLSDASVVIEMDMDGKIIAANKSTEELFLYSKTELLNLSMIDLLDESSREEYKKNRILLEKDPSMVPITFKHNKHNHYGIKKNGEKFFLDRSISFININDKKYIMVNIRDITKCKNNEQTIEETTSALAKQQTIALCAKEQAKQKEEFIDTLCHELRNPLHGIYGGIHLIKESLKSLGPLLSTEEQQRLFQKAEEDLEVITKCAEQQKSIVDDTLTISKLENNKVTLCSDPFELTETIKNIFCSNYRKKIRINIRHSSSSYMVKRRSTSIITNYYKFNI